jgi:hypothetical protein
MKYNRMLVWFWLCLGLKFWCIAGDATVNPSLAIRTIAKGTASGIDQERSEAIRDQAAWSKLWLEHKARARSASETPPEVDFTKEIVLALTLGRKNSGGYSVEMVAANPAKNEIVIHCIRKSPPPGAMTIQVLTNPFHFVAIPITQSSIRFVYD